MAVECMYLALSPTIPEYDCVVWLNPGQPNTSELSLVPTEARTVNRMDSTSTIYSLASHSGLVSAPNSELPQPPQTGSFSSLAVIEHLQNNLRLEQERRLLLEKDVLGLRKRLQELEQQLELKTESLSKTGDVQQAQLESIKQRLLRTLKDSSAGSQFPLSTNQNYAPWKKVEFDHQCDECQFRTKSEVALILHKLNHGITDHQLILSTTFFTTRNSNSKSIYKCPACDSATNLTRHEVYRHIYDVHTNEKPIVCPYCELSFTHKEYLNQHIPIKHAKLPTPKTQSVTTGRSLHDNSQNKDVGQSLKVKPHLLTNSTSSPSSSDQNVLSSSGSTNQTANKNQSNPSPRGRPSGSNIIKRPVSQTELKCTFLDCNFVTVFQDKLDFHMKAHVNTKYKCPYCPYVSNTIIDIKRHIQKSKKHDGMKMYSCQKCGFGADCDRVFKEHLRVYHFGYEAPDTMIDYFIEEMFSNKNKRVDEDDATVSASAAAVAALNAMGSISNVDHLQPPPKKLAIGTSRAITPTTSGTKVIIPSSRASCLSTMIEEEPSQASIDAISAQTISNSYRAVTSGHHNLTNIGSVLPNSSNSVNSLAMFHGLDLASQEHGSSSHSSQSFHHQHGHHQSLSSIPVSAVSMAHHHQPGQSGGAEPLVSMQEGFAQAINQAANSGELPAGLQQYVTYANY